MPEASLDPGSISSLAVLLNDLKVGTIVSLQPLSANGAISLIGEIEDFSEIAPASIKPPYQRLIARNS